MRIVTASKADLINMCKARGLSTKGTKEMLQQSLLNKVGKENTQSNSPQKEKVDIADTFVDGIEEQFSDIISVIDKTDLHTLQIRGVAFIGNMKNMLLKIASDRRLAGKLKNPMMLGRTELASMEAKKILYKEFEAYSSPSHRSVVFADFCK